MDKYINFIKQANHISSLKGITAHNKKSKLSIILFDLCNEHLIAINLLLDQGLHGAGMALVRPATEALIRGLWVTRRIDPDDNEKIDRLMLKTSEWPSFSKMEKETNNDFTIPMEYANKKYGLMCNFTHGSGQQIMNRINGETLAFRLDPTQLLHLYRELVILSYISNGVIIKASGNAENLQAIRSLWKELGIEESNFWDML